jgi:hypothetical protein
MSIAMYHRAPSSGGLVNQPGACEFCQPRYQYMSTSVEGLYGNYIVCLIYGDFLIYGDYKLSALDIVRLPAQADYRLTVAEVVPALRVPIL